jgi:hypothetical protein
VGQAASAVIVDWGSLAGEERDRLDRMVPWAASEYEKTPTGSSRSSSSKTSPVLALTASPDLAVIISQAQK